MNGQRAVEFKEVSHQFPIETGFLLGVFLTFGIIHLTLFTIRKQKADLFLSIAAFSAVVAYATLIFIGQDDKSLLFITLNQVGTWLSFEYVWNLFLFLAIHQLFCARKNFYFRFLVGYYIVAPVFYFFLKDIGPYLGLAFPFILTMTEALRVAWKAYRRGDRDAIIIVMGVAFYLLVFIGNDIRFGTRRA